MFNIQRLIQEKLSWADRKKFRNAWGRGRLDFKKDGAIVVGSIAQVYGRYRLADGSVHPNITTQEGQSYMLQTSLEGLAAEAAWYVALWNDPVTPLESWTAATFASAAGEIIDGLSEGYTGDRPQFIPNTPHADPVTNSDSPCSYSIVTGSSLSIQGSALISSMTRGGTTGVLMSAAAFTGGARTQYNGDTFKNVFEQGLEPAP